MSRKFGEGKVSMKQILTDDEIIERIQLDDAASFENLYNRYWHSLFIFSKKLVNSHSDAQDIVQNIFISLWEKRHSLTISHSLQSYLFQAVRYRALNKLKELLDTPMDIETVHERFLPIVNDFIQALEHDELAQTIEQHVEALPNRTREIFRMSRYEHLSIEEISKALGLSEQTVKNQISMALQSLREGIVLSLLITNINL